MSDVKRYSDLQVWETLHFGGSTNGWVRFEDYARLQAEVERLTELDENAKATIDDRNAYIKQLLFCRPAMEELKAEVERLRKAGDEMEKVIILAECIAGVEHTEKSAIAWNAAKEGKQS